MADTEALADRSRRAGANQLFLTAVEASELFRLDESTMYRHLRAGTFPGVKIGGRYVVPRAVIDQLIADVLATGRCVDLGRWTEDWRATQDNQPGQRTSYIAGGRK